MMSTEDKRRFFRPVTFVLSNENYNQDKVILPTRKTAYSAGYDFICPKDVAIQPHSTSGLIMTNVKVHLPKDEYLALHIRSSLAVKRGLALVNGTAIIDADYYNNPDNDGNIGLCFVNYSNSWRTIKKGERVAQGIFCKYGVTFDDDTEDVRVGGFGSTGKE